MRLVLLLMSLIALPALAQEAARPWIGIGIEKGKDGVRVKEIMPATPAEKAGLKVGDEVISIDDQAVKEPQQLIDLVTSKGVGSKVRLWIVRDGKTVEIDLALEARPDELALLRSQLENKPAPDFALAQSKGAYPAKLADLVGNVVVVEFWATWCGPCQTTMPRLSSWQDKYGKQGLRVVGISAEPIDLITKKTDAKKLSYTLASDSDGSINGAYHVIAIPTLVVIDRGGVIRHVEIGAGDNLDEVEAMIQKLLDAKD
jgi:peroxiredoxin